MIKTFNHQIIFFLIFINTFLYNYLENTLGTSFIDELSILIIIFLAFFSILLNGFITFNSNEVKILFLFTGVVLIGLVSNYYYQYQESTAITNDAIVFCKPLATYFATRVAFKKINIINIYKYYKRVFIIIFFILSLLTIINLIFSIFESYETRFGIPVQELFFGHPSKYAFAFALIFLFLYPSTNKHILFWVLIFGCFSLRAKYFGFSLIASICLYFSKLLRIKINLSRTLFIGIFLIIVLYLFFYEQISYYYSEEAFINRYARAILNVISLQIANDFFPLGSGFSTFASYYSGVYYSPLYSIYGISDVWGLGGGKNYNFISDTFWPMILSQFGYIGFISYILIFILFLRMYIIFFNSATTKLTKKIFLSAILIIVYMLIDSTADSTITQNRGVVCFLLLGIITNFKENYK